MKKLRVEEVIVVEGKYDAAKLADLVVFTPGSSRTRRRIFR